MISAPSEIIGMVNTKLLYVEWGMFFCEAEIPLSGRRREAMRRPEATRSRRPYRIVMLHAGQENLREHCSRGR
jgi:hypothetical protein